MSEARDDVAQWMRAGAIAPSRARESLEVLGGAPSATSWRSFLDRVLLVLGAVALAAALGFFVAANWQALGRYGKLLLIQSLLVIAIAVAVWRSLDTSVGRAALLVAALAAGTLLAFVGQTYQTGADSWELFGSWALAILPWVAVSRQPAMWILWLAIVDVAVTLYSTTMPGLWAVAADHRTALWAMLAIHATAAVGFEAGAARGVAWLDSRWALRWNVVFGVAVATLLAINALVMNRRAAPDWPALVAFALVSGVVYYGYRVRRTDMLLLACVALSGIAFVVALLARAELYNSAAGLLLIGLAIVALAGLAARWLRSVARGAGT